MLSQSSNARRRGRARPEHPRGAAVAAAWGLAIVMAVMLPLVGGAHALSHTAADNPAFESCAHASAPRCAGHGVAEQASQGTDHDDTGRTPGQPAEPDSSPEPECPTCVHLGLHAKQAKAGPGAGWSVPVAAPRDTNAAEPAGPARSAPPRAVLARGPPVRA